MCGFCTADGQAGEEHSDLCVAQRQTASAVAAAYRAINAGSAKARTTALEVLAWESRLLVDAVRAA
jgi:hypothetical protein